MAEYLAPRAQQEMELAAFEKGRIQGELEANRRMEQEAHLHQKQMIAPNEQMAVNTQMQRPDIVEINRLTWLQRAAAVVGELATLAFVVLTIVWLDEYRGDVSWRDDSDGGNVTFFNTHYLCAALGLFFLAQAITNYRIAPLNMAPMLNRVWYLFLQSSAIICFTLALVSLIRSSPESDSLWSVSHWCFCFGYAVFVLHALYSMIVTILEPMHHRTTHSKYGGNYNEWSETGTHLETPEQRRDHSAYNHLARTVYTAAPVNVHTRTPAVPAANANVGAQVPVAPANAPRWAENPNTHSEHYWLLPRAKWAVVGFWAIGVSILMDLAASQNLLAAGRPNWAQASNNVGDGIDERGAQATLIGCLGLMTLLSLACMSYVAMPPRTSIVKNGILVDPNAARRPSVSHNAETRLGNNIV